MIVVTGGAGFIGSNLVAGLVERGERELVVSDRLRSGEKWRNLARHDLTELIHPDHLLAWLEAHAGQVRAILHMGAISSTTETDADLIADTNLRLPLRLWEWCTREEVPLIYASSAATYGDGSRGFQDQEALEALAGLRPLNAYGWSKLAFDRRAVALAAQGSAPPHWVGLRFFNVYGPNEYHKGGMRSVVEQAFRTVSRGDPIRLFRSHDPGYGDGEQLRDFIHVEDCVEVALWLLDHPGVSGIFNCGTGRARTFMDLARSVCRSMDQPERVTFVDTPAEIRDRYQYFTQASMGKLRSAGFEGRFRSLEEGVDDYIRRYLRTGDPYR